MADNSIPHLGAQFTDHVGRIYKEVPMPAEYAYDHPLHSYGEPRRLEVVDPSESRRFAVSKGYVRPNEEGTPGLVGYTDFYREPPRERGFVGERQVLADTNIGFMNVHPEHQQRGIASEMVKYIDRTTDPNSTVNMGKAMHEATVYISQNINKEKPNRVHYKMMFNVPKRDR